MVSDQVHQAMEFGNMGFCFRFSTWLFHHDIGMVVYAVKRT